MKFQPQRYLNTDVIENVQKNMTVGLETGLTASWNACIFVHVQR